MKDNNVTIEQIAAEAKMDLCEKVDQWVRYFKDRSGDLSTFPSITQLEDSMLKLDSETRKIFLDMVSDTLSNYDEKQMIASKKESSS